MTSEEERGRSGGDPPGAEEEAGGGDEPRDGAPVPALAQVDVPVAHPRRRSAAAARGRHAESPHRAAPTSLAGSIGSVGRPGSVVRASPRSDCGASGIARRGRAGRVPIARDFG